MKNVIDHPAKHSHVIENPWRKLRDFTDARIGLGRAGVSIPTAHLLAFQLAHAQAQDAVHLPLDTEKLIRDLKDEGVLPGSSDLIQLHSQAHDRSEYLQRPDLGRRLDDDSAQLLKQFNLEVYSGSTDNSENRALKAFDLAVVIADGLSSLAIQQNTTPFLAELYQALSNDDQSWQLAPITLVKQARVAVGDEVGELLNARCVLLMVGERPGLSSPDSLGLYMTWNPKVGLTDASRNCISNVRQGGMAYSEAVRKLMYLLKESRSLKLSGVNLKDRTEEGDLTVVSGDKTAATENFLVSD